MGLLDFNMPGMDTPEGQGLLSAAFSLMSAKKLPGQKGAFAGALGDAGQQYLQSSNASNESGARSTNHAPAAANSQASLPAASSRKAPRRSANRCARSIASSPAACTRTANPIRLSVRAKPS